MKRAFLLVLLLLTGCASSEAQLAAQSAQDDRQCVSYGAKAGSDAYVNCRSQLASARSAAAAVEDAAGTVALSNVRAPSTRY